MHRSGYVNIVGNPNVGKSTLMNALLGDKLSIITSKPQTTRHRILGIWNDENTQIIFSDSPGVIDDPKYALHKRMNSSAFEAFEDADLLLFVTDVFEKYEGDEKLIQLTKKLKCPKYLIINKIDQLKPGSGKVGVLEKFWTDLIPFDKVFAVSAMEKIGLADLLVSIRDVVPEGPAYYPKDQLSDKNERFFVTEMIREQLLQQYKQEVPYACEVVVESFKEGESKNGPIIRIMAVIYVERPNQKNIIIGKGGLEIKKLGTTARLEMEKFFNSQIHLELHVTVKEDWRNSDKLLGGFGYGNT